VRLAGTRDATAWHCNDMWLGVLGMRHLRGGASQHYAFCMALADRGLLVLVAARARKQRRDTGWRFALPPTLTKEQVRDAALVLFA